MTPDFTGIPQLHVTVPDPELLNPDTKIVGTVISTNGYGSNVTSEGLYVGKVDLKQAGNSTALSPKKPYNVTTLTAAGANNDIPWLNLPAGRDWRLMANAYDLSHLKNQTAFTLCNQLSHIPWSPKCRPVELYINEVYQGLYGLFERVKVHPDRLRLSGSGIEAFELEITAKDQADVGAYFIDTPVLNDGETVANPPWEHALALDFPKASTTSQPNKDALAALFLDFETKLVAHDFDAVFDYIDIDSAVDHLIFQEFLKNYDGPRMGSWRICRDNPAGYLGGKMFFTSWDMDITLKNQFEFFATQMDDWIPDDGLWVSQGLWYQHITQSTLFMDTLKVRFAALLPLLYRHIALFEADAEFLDASGAYDREYTKWGALPLVGTVASLYTDPVAAAADTVTALKARLAWLRGQWITPTVTTKKPVVI